MKANTLLAKLRLLTLAGYEDGEYIWIGTDQQWNKLVLEEESILRDWEIKRELETSFNYDYQLNHQK